MRRDGIDIWTEIQGPADRWFALLASYWVDRVQWIRDDDQRDGALGMLDWPEAREHRDLVEADRAARAAFAEMGVVFDETHVAERYAAFLEAKGQQESEMTQPSGGNGDNDPVTGAGT